MKTNTYTHLLAKFNGHRLYLAQFPAKEDECELTLFNSLRYVGFGRNKSILSLFKEFRTMCASKIPNKTKFFVYLYPFENTCEIWSREYH